MKKILSLLLCLLTVCGLVSCNKDNNSKDKILLEKQEGIKTAIDLYSDEITQKINNGDTFLIYGYLPTCGTCQGFKRDILDLYITKNEVVVYSSYVADLMLVDKSLPNRAPYLATYVDGELKDIYTYAKYKDIFLETKEFNEFMDKHFIVSSMSEVNFAQLDQHLASNESFIVYFGWFACGDCTYMNDAYLKEFLKTNDKKFYYVETDEYRKDKETKPEEWKAFADKDQFGDYNGGRIPSIVYYENGKKKDMCVYFNDSFEWNETDKTLKVTGSFYEDNPNIGKTFTTYSDYQKTSEAFFNAKLDAFFKKNL